MLKCKVLMEPVHTVSDKDSISDILDQFVKGDNKFSLFLMSLEQLMV